MNVIYDLNKLVTPLEKPVITIGNFDGVHRGHLALFKKVRERSDAIRGQAAVMTFEPHPIRIMKSGKAIPLITPVKQKLELIGKAGIDVIFCVPFTREFAAITAESFVLNILLGKIGVKELVVGYDYSFGHQREGNVDFLQKMGDKWGFRVHVMGPIHVEEAPVSSTLIRGLVQNGRLSEAKTQLGRDYQISGTVVKGQNRGGRLLGIPTANLNLIDELIPRRGVYAVTVIVDDRAYNGVTNIGYNPTFGDTGLTVETHLLDFAEDILGKTIKVNFIQRLRDEVSFDSIQDLSDQIGRDIQQARELLEVHETAGQ
jgi:riboflavin kinase/FMN adenylyltransferase